MQKLAIVFSFAVPVAAASSHVDLFEEFVKSYRREYNLEEKKSRFEIFKANMQMIEASNAKNLSYTLGVTPYTDLTFEEFRAQYVGGMMPLTEHQKQNMTKFQKPTNFTAPDSVDWVSKGAVTSVKNQGKCGSCWSFSAAGALEGAMAVAGRTLVDLSEQDLLDCDTGLLGGHGCNGGNPAQAFGWVKSNGMCAAADYPYVCEDPTTESCKSATCSKAKCTTPALKAGGWFHSGGDVTEYGMVDHDEGSLEAAVARQPISVAIEADQAVFQHYTGGVLSSDACGQTLDHGVLVVGYGEQKSILSGTQQYWTIKNSWGASWGEKGYIRIARGKKNGYGECGLREAASFPTVKPASDDTIIV